MSNVKLLPLPEWAVDGTVADDDLPQRIQDYARANVEANTKALRTERDAYKSKYHRAVDDLSAVSEQAEALRAEWLKALGVAMQARAEAKVWQGAADARKAHAERLTEALRMIEGFTMSQFPGAADMAGACVETAHNALHPTAAQENRNA